MFVLIKNCLKIVQFFLSGSGKKLMILSNISNLHFGKRIEVLFEILIFAKFNELNLNVVYASHTDSYLK